MEETTGAIVQLLARGKQNLYLDGEDTSLFRTIHKRSTPFALEHREEYFPSGFKFGQTCRVDVPKRSDSMGEWLLQITLPQLTNDVETAVRWSPNIVYSLVRRVQVYMAGILVVDNERLWNFVSDSLYVPNHRRYYTRGVHRPVNKEHRIIIPLNMPWKTSRFFPLIATDVPIWLEVEVESLASCVEGGPPPSTKQPTYAALLVQNVFMERTERYTFLYKPLSFPITWVDDMETVFTSASKQIKVDLSEINSPVKALIWVVYRLGDSSFQFIKDVFINDALCLESQLLTSDTSSFLSSYAGRWRRNVSSQDDGVHVMSLGAPPEDPLISGGLDFGKAKRPFLLLRVRQHVLQEGQEYVCKVFAQSSRSIRIQQGQVGVF